MSATATTQTPAEIDAEIATTGVAAARALRTLTFYSERVASGRYADADQLVEAKAAYQAAAEVAAAAAARYAGWSRFFIVTNSNGHVHSSTNCGTCFPTTQYGWLTELSGATEAEAVVEYGQMMCTVCFPSAPTYPAWSTKGRIAEAAKAAKAAEKAERDAAKAAKALAQPVRIDGDVIRTKVAAQRKLSDAVQSFGFYGPSHPMDFAGQVAILVAALEAEGIDPQPIIARAAKKVAKEGGRFSL